MGSEIDNIAEHQEFTEKLLRKTELENKASSALSRG